jgi:hypothetical protein
MSDFLEKEVDEAFCVSVIKKEVEICPNVMLGKKEAKFWRSFLKFG